MAKRRGNPNWGKPEPYILSTSICSFDSVVKMLKLTPDQEKLVRERTQLFLSTPELRGAMLSQFADLVNQIAELLATRAGKKTSDFAVRNMAGAVLGVLLASMLMITEDPKADMVKLADHALAHLEAGLPLDWKA